MSKNTITRAQAIDYAISAVEHTREYWETDGDWSPEKSDEIIAILKKMHEQLVKPRAKAVSKARLANEGLARKVAAMLPAEGIGSKAIVGLGLPEVATTQKAAAVMCVACELGLAEKVADKKNITYKPVTAE